MSLPDDFFTTHRVVLNRFLHTPPDKATGSFAPFKNSDGECIYLLLVVLPGFPINSFPITS